MMGSQPPLGCWVPTHGPSPRPRRRMAQEAFKAYGKCSPLPASPHLPFPPGYVPLPVSVGTGGSRHGTLNTLRRRGDCRQGAAAVCEPRVKAHTKEKDVKVPCVLATCLCFAPNAIHGACGAPKRQSSRVGRQQGEQEVQRCTKPETATEGTKGAEEGCTAKPQAPEKAKRKQRRIDNKGAPPSTPPPPREVEEESGRTEGVPPADKAAGWGGSRERARNHKAVPKGSSHRTCPKQREHRGRVHRVQRAMKGDTRQTPSQRDKCRASCLHRARNVNTPEDRLQGRPPPPHAPTHGGKGRGRRGDGKGAWRGTQDRPPRRRGRRAASGGDARQPEPGPETKNLSGERQLGQTGHGTNQEAQKGAREGGNPREQSGEARTKTADKGGPGRQEPARDAGEEPNLSGLGAPPVTVSSPPERAQ